MPSIHDILDDLYEIRDTLSEDAPINKEELSEDIGKIIKIVEEIAYSMQGDEYD
jgi:hypothetical protein